jgi:hypothetical protein
LEGDKIWTKAKGEGRRDDYGYDMMVPKRGAKGTTIGRTGILVVVDDVFAVKFCSFFFFYMR